MMKKNGVLKNFKRVTILFVSILLLMEVTGAYGFNYDEPHWSSAGNHNPPYIEERLYSDPYSGCDDQIARWCSLRAEEGSVCDLSVPIKVIVHVSGDGFTPSTAECAVWYKSYNWGGYQYYSAPSVRYHKMSGCEGSTLTKLGCSNAGNSMGGSCPSADQGNPVNVSIGNKHQSESDYIGGGDFSLQVRRVYNSELMRWTFIERLRISDVDGDGSPDFVLTTRLDGKTYLFVAGSAGTWDKTTEMSGKLESLNNEGGEIIGWRYTRLDQTVEEYGTTGDLLKVTHRSGLSHTYTHSPNSITVTHSNGASLVYLLDNLRRIVSFTTPDNKTYTYSYDSLGNLLNIIFPDNYGLRTYHYEDASFPNTNALTGITDENGDRFATWAYDSAGRAISSEHHGGAEKVTIDYTHIDDETDPRSVATNALGKQTREDYLVKMDNNGNELWSNTYSSHDYYNSASTVRQTSDGGYIIVGSARDYEGFNAVHLIKIDDSGDEVWSKTFGNTEAGYEGTSVQQTKNGGYIISGDKDYSEGFLIMTDSNGNNIWSKSYDVSIYDVQQSMDGGYILAGQRVIKTDSKGNEIWTIVFDRSDGIYYTQSVDQTMDGGYIFTGYIAYPNAPGATVSETDIFLLKTDNLGNETWISFFGDDRDYGYANSVRQTVDGGYIIGGYVSYWQSGETDSVLIKTDSKGNINKE